MTHSYKEALLIEDDVGWQAILNRELRKAKYIIDPAFSKDEALFKIAKGIEEYALIVLDPCLDKSLGSLSGMIILDEIKNSSFSPPVIMISGYENFKELKKKLIRFRTIIDCYFEKGNFDTHGFRTTLLNLENNNFIELAKILEGVKSAKTNKEKQESLENISEKLLETIPFFKCCERNKRTATSELDRIFKIAGAKEKFFQEWGAYLVVEAKNWSEPIDSKVISEFALKLKNAKCKVGIIFTKSGITGNVGFNGRGQIRNVYQELDITILTVSLRDLENIITSKKNLQELLEEKYRDVCFSA